LAGSGCVVINLAPGQQGEVNAQQLAGANIACAGARSTYGWQVWIPYGASVTFQSIHQGQVIGSWSGGSGTATGYCGTVFVQNPNAVAVTVHVNWKMWDCTAGTC